jgi:glycosyltransferase involved in cell wall biosynthesis
LAEGKLRVLMIAPTPFFADRGCHVRILEEARTLLRKGHDVRVATYHLGRDLPDIPSCRIPGIPWYRKLSAGPSWHKPYLDILLFFKSVSVARDFRPHLIHAHLHEGAFLGLFLKMLLGVPLLFDCQGSMTTEMADHGFVRKGGMLYRLFRCLEGFVNRGTDHIITSSGPAARELREDWGVPEGRVSALMDGVNADEFRPCPGEDARAKMGLPPDVPVAVFLGVMNRYQGMDILLEVVRRVKERGVPLHFLVMGFPEEDYRRKALESGLDDRITFTGRIDYREAARCLSAGDVALSPKISLAEANGKLFNYMACGLPTLAFDTPVNREILGDAGVYAAFADASDYADKLVMLATDPVMRRELAVKGRERAVGRHSWEARGEELEKVYGELLLKQ